MKNKKTRCDSTAARPPICVYFTYFPLANILLENGPSIAGQLSSFLPHPPVVEVIRNSNEDAVGRRQSCPNASVYRPCPCRLCLHRSENSHARSTTPTSTPSTGRICHLYGNTQLLGTLLNWGHNVIYRGYCCRLCLTKCAL
jgi:hypothetical protein